MPERYVCLVPFSSSHLLCAPPTATCVSNIVHSHMNCCPHVLGGRDRPGSGRGGGRDTPGRREGRKEDGRRGRRGKKENYLRLPSPSPIVSPPSPSPSFSSWGISGFCVVSPRKEGRGGATCAQGVASKSIWETEWQQSHFGRKAFRHPIKSLLFLTLWAFQLGRSYNLNVRMVPSF